MRTAPRSLPLCFLLLPFFLFNMKKLDLSKRRTRPDPSVTSGAFELQAIWSDAREFLHSVFTVWQTDPNSEEPFRSAQLGRIRQCLEKHASPLVRVSAVLSLCTVLYTFLS